VFFGDSQIEVLGNRVDAIGADAFKFGSVDTARVENNFGPSFLYPDEKTHSDFMQFQGNASHNLVIRGNVFLPQNRFDTQGIFVAGKGGHSNVLIEQNIIYTQMANGIYVAKNSNGVTIRDNTLIAADGDVTRITRPEGATVTNNIFSGRKGELDNGNLSMQGADPAGDHYFSSLFPGIGLRQSHSLADLTPKAGSLAETMGAAQRLRELLAL
jgi:hypothetical protein